MNIKDTKKAKQSAYTKKYWDKNSNLKAEISAAKKRNQPSNNNNNDPTTASPKKKIKPSLLNRSLENLNTTQSSQTQNQSEESTEELSQNNTKDQN